MPPPLLAGLEDGRRWLIIVAAPKEAAAIVAGLGGNATAEPWRLVEAGPRFDLVLSGVGKANAAGAVSRMLRVDRHVGALSLGVCGTLPGGGASVCDVILGTESVYADEGLITDAGFQDVGQMGFPPGMNASEGVACAGDSEFFEALRDVADVSGRIATVSTCSGTDESAQAVRDRTSAVAEAMEGAAVGFCARRIATLAGASLRFGEARVASNRTGARGAQEWDLEGALRRLSDLCARL